MFILIFFDTDSYLKYNTLQTKGIIIMVTLVEISNDDENSLKLDYLFVQEATGIDWKSRYQMSCIFK